jgi:cholest-4-en-3-one 26-monooxygenase
MAVDTSYADLSSPDTFVPGVPFETFDRLRKEDPVYFHEEPDGPGFWCVTRYDDLVAVNRDNQLFSSNRKTALFMESDEEMLAQQRLMMLNMDPPMHTRYRLLVNQGFTPRRVTALKEDIRRRTNEIIDSVAEKGEADFVVEMSAELPLQVIADMLGVPQEERHLVFDWSNRMVGSQDPEYLQDPELAQNASMELYSYFNQLSAQRRIDPKEDLVTALLNAEVNGEKLDELELDLFFLLLSVAGNETTRNAISHGMVALSEHPDQKQRLIDDPSLVNSAVEEILRWSSPVMHFRRQATAPTQIGDQKIGEDEKVVFWHISANRDEAHFDDPYKFDVGRSPNEHVAFGGGGPHFCLGANLARLEMQVFFEELVKRLPDIEVSGEVQRLRSNFINGLKHIPVSFSKQPKLSAV